MKLLRALVALALIPDLIAGSDGKRPTSVSQLLLDPWNGQATLTFSDGTRREGAILRVTDQFVTFRRSPQVCEDIELSRIVGIQWSSGKQSASDTIGGVFTLLFAVPLVPFAVPWALYAAVYRASHPTDPIWGDWESIHHQTPGRTEIDRIQFEPNNRNATTQDPGDIRRTNVVIEEGTYRVDGETLHVTQLTGGLEGDMPFHFECDALVAAASTRVHRLTPSKVQPHTAYAPVVGEWIEHWVGVPTTWEFKPDGVLHIKRIERPENGRFVRTKKSVKVTFPGTAGEEWDVRVKSGRLFISNGGKVTEYKKAPAN